MPVSFPIHERAACGSEVAPVSNVESNSWPVGRKRRYLPRTDPCPAALCSLILALLVASSAYGEVTAICWNPGDRSRLVFIVWLCLVKRKDYIVAAFTIFGRFNGIELRLRHDRNNGDTRLFQACADASHRSEPIVAMKSAVKMNDQWFWFHRPGVCPGNRFCHRVVLDTLRKIESLRHFALCGPLTCCLQYR